MALAMKMIDSIVQTVFGLFFKLINREYTEQTHQRVMQFVKFGIVGVSNTIVCYLIYAGTLILLQRADLFSEFDYLVAQAVAFILSVLWSFYWNNKFVFKVEEGKSRNMLLALLKTYISYSFSGLFLNFVLLIIFVRFMGMSEFVAPIVNLFIAVPINYIINKYWAFKTN